MSVDVRTPGPADTDALLAFFERIPEGERAFFKEDVLDRAAVASWLDPDRRGRRAIAVAEDRVAGYVAVIPGLGWSDHVGEVRLVVAPGFRGRGIGRLLARQAVLDAVACGLRKLVVEVVAEQEGAVVMFEALGFRAEGLLRDHVRDAEGRLHDLVLLSHALDEEWAGMVAAGIADAVH